MLRFDLAASLLKINQMNIKIRILVAAFILVSCKAQKVDNSLAISTSFQSILDDAVADSKLNLAGVSMTVIAPDLEISWSGAAGFDSTKKDQELSADQPFRIASITKTFVAAATLRLHEMGKLSIEDPISKYIAVEHQKILEKDGYDPSAISIKQCLLHRSGLYDYAMGGEDFVQTVAQDPFKRWTRTEQVQFAMDHGEPLGKPGDVYSYSDTGYILVGEILEKVSQKTLAEALRSLLNFEALGMHSTWLESLEDKPAGLPDAVHRYFNGTDATGWDNSLDLYGGGGIASTTHDLGIFYSAIFNGQLFQNENTLALMLTDAGEVQERHGAESYRLGLWQIPALDSEGFMHNGFWGSAVAHVPKYNFTVSVNYTNDTNGAGLFKKTAAIIKKLENDRRK